MIVRFFEKKKFRKRPLFWDFFSGFFGPFFLESLLKNVDIFFEKKVINFGFFKNRKKNFRKHPFLIKRASWHNTRIFIFFSLSEFSGFFRGDFRGLFSRNASQTLVKTIKKSCQKIAKSEIFFRFFSKNHKFYKSRFLAA